MESLSKNNANWLFNEMTSGLNEDEKMSDHYGGRFLSGMLGVAAAIETIVSGIFLVLSYCIKNIGREPKKLYKAVEEWNSSAANACKDLFKVAAGKDISLKGKINSIFPFKFTS